VRGGLPPGPRAELDPATTRLWVCAYANNQWELGAKMDVALDETPFARAMGAAEYTLVIILRSRGRGVPPDLVRL